ncbi:hypothetical protein [Protaetiibacter mangrovi]|uniref:Lipoprotein n=1 Tax=Protaetiibacter mangrovi TaxID=2970926 RepID=A0ABT1ZCM6_9MICO|nr:hypothetical protein [Protaetiibacter mangrovi]MCS0498461.1 hypothetical protein [Protaetiibacter mangrovi]TPW91772.1 hypothetical protein FJ656_35650 [Schumannella luteola]
MRPRLVTTVAVAAATLLALTSCEQFWFAGGAGGGASASGTPAAADDPDAAGDASTDQNAADAACPMGRWQLDNASWSQALAALVADGFPDATVTVEGTQTLDWNAGGDYLMTADRVVYTVVGTSDGQPYTLVITHDGAETGRWSGGDGLTDGTYTLTTVDDSGWASTVTISAGGGSQHLDPDEMTADPWAGEVQVRCVGDLMRNTVSAEGTTATVDFTRRG